MVRHLRARQAVETTQAQASEQLTEGQIVAHIRQSSTRQTRENLESADLQLSGAQKFAIEKGLNAGKIVIVHEGEGKRGVSGTLRIDQREDLQGIMALIYADKIKYVCDYSVSRLFRDRYGVQVGTFMQACAEHHVKVHITTAKTFDFTNSFDVMMFQFLANIAARENEDRARLSHEANRNKALRGGYDGRPLIAGFIVDTDKKSPTYGHYIPYEPHKRVVNRLLKRHRQRGEFNQLASEVEKMTVVFPPFEGWVNKESIARFDYVRVCAIHGPDRKTKVKDEDGKWHYEPVGCQFKGEDCKFIGYHISSIALKNLLIAPELMGYWTVDDVVLTDANGELLVVHERIVDDPADWEYAFYRYSPTLLDGSPNPHRINSRATRTAATVKQVDKEPRALLLDGLLTSPQGTVHYVPSEDAYAVFEKRHPNRHRRSKTLTIGARWIEDEFRQRLLDRINDTNYEQMLYDALRNAQANNAQALISVDKQIANYQQAIKIKQAKLDALGEDFDKETAQQYNEDIKDARANIAALKAKQNEAAAEEQDLQDLCTELWNFRNHGKRTNEKLIRFIRLATSKISIEEYSSHFIRLTVAWCAPFPQVDVCYFYRETGGKLGWSEEEKRDLAGLYPHTDRRELLERFPTKTWLCIASYAQERGLKRHTGVNTSGIIDHSLSLADWNLMQKYGWAREKGTHWLENVDPEGYGDLPILC